MADVNEGALALRLLAARLKEAGETGLKRELQKNIRNAAQPLAREIASLGHLIPYIPDRYAAVLSVSGQDTRMMSTPASSQRRIWSIVARGSLVGVLVIVWTVTGAPPPTGTLPTMMRRVARRGKGAIQNLTREIRSRRSRNSDEPAMNTRSRNTA